jgi:CheY-like chemotaxis protein
LDPWWNQPPGVYLFARALPTFPRVSGRALLLIDDDDDIVNTVRMILERRGWTVASAVDGSQALELLRGGLRPALILLDLMMPGLNGWQFTEALRADPSLAQPPIAVLSGAGDVAEKAARLGAVAHLRKPFELSALIELVRTEARPEGEPAATS